MMVWLVVVLALMIPLIAVVLDSQLGRALAGRIESDRRLGGEEPVGRRVAQLEAEIERLNQEVLRLDEETTFLHRLLEDKPPTAHGERLMPGQPEAHRPTDPSAKGEVELPRGEQPT
jgi:hypothetical protein